MTGDYTFDVARVTDSWVNTQYLPKRFSSSKFAFERL